MRKCWKCESGVPDTSRFCGECGSDLRYGVLPRVGLYNVLTPVRVGGVLFYREMLAMPNSNRETVLAMARENRWFSDNSLGVSYVLVGYARDYVAGVAVLPTEWMRIDRIGVVQARVPDVVLLLPPKWVKQDGPSVTTGYAIFMKAGDTFVRLGDEMRPTPEQLVRYAEEGVLKEPSLQPTDEIYCGKFVRVGEETRIVELRRIYQQARLGDPQDVNLRGLF